MMRRKVFAEFLGSFILLFVGCGAIVVDGITQGLLGHVGVCAAWGLTVMSVIYALGDVSGAHINPAVTLAFSASAFETAAPRPTRMADSCSNNSISPCMVSI